jgi:hypothetical protein
MQAINSITVFFMEAMKKMCAESRSGGGNIVQTIDKMRVAAGEPLNDDTREAIENGVEMATMALVTASIADIANAMNTAGRVLMQIAAPEEAAKFEPLLSPAELKKAADQAAVGLAEVLHRAKTVSLFTLESVNFAHIAEMVMAEEMPAVEAAEKARLAKSQPAKPIHGTATPLWTPSQN